MRLTNRLAVNNRILEYFVVFIIIVSLTVVSFVLLQGILAETRDSQRVGDIVTVRTALELYHIDHGVYPHTGWANSATASWNTLGEALRPYLTTMPLDPINDAMDRVERTGAFNYSYYSAEKKNRGEDGRDDYVLVFRLEKPETAPLHQKAERGLSTAHGTFSFVELTGEEGIYAIKAP